jgi:hypothetical protein
VDAGRAPRPRPRPVPQVVANRPGPDISFEGVHLGRYSANGFERELVDLRGGSIRELSDVSCSLGFGALCPSARFVGGHTVVRGHVLTAGGRIYIPELGQFDTVDLRMIRSPGACLSNDWPCSLFGYAAANRWCSSLGMARSQIRTP